jgi:two-component system response regulator YesN
MLLVEDESFERNSLMNFIDWDLIGVQIIGEAANGAQGITMVIKLRPDIVLTDVKMPVMDGIEMSRKIRNIAPETQIIFLSSYDDFEYAKQAIDLSIQAYLMKPVNEGELLRVVKKASDEVAEKMLNERLYDKMKNNYSISLGLARQALVNRMLTGMQVSGEDAHNLGLEWLQNKEDKLCLFLCIYNNEQLDLNETSMETLNQNCSKIYRKSINVCISAGRLITLCAVTEQDGEQTSRKVEHLLQQFFNFKEKGVDILRIEKVCDTDTARSPDELYKEILKRNVIGYMEPSHVVSKMKNKQQIVNQIEQIIHTQYQMPITLESIAHMLHFTPNYIGNIFKTIKKISVNRYLMKVRMEKAEQLLLDSNYSINDISEQCGFGSITYFHTTFKKEKGITPSEFRQSRGKTL